VKEARRWLIPTDGSSLIGVGELTGFGLHAVKCSTVASPGHACAVDRYTR
jgi:hypothetical protein